MDSWIGMWNDTEIAAEVVIEVESKVEFPTHVLLFNYLNRNMS